MSEQPNISDDDIVNASETAKTYNKFKDQTEAVQRVRYNSDEKIIFENTNLGALSIKKVIDAMFDIKLSYLINIIDML